MENQYELGYEDCLAHLHTFIHDECRMAKSGIKSPKIFRLYYGMDHELEGEYDSFEEMYQGWRKAIARDKKQGLNLSYSYEEYERRKIETMYDAECGF